MLSRFDNRYWFLHIDLIVITYILMPKTNLFYFIGATVNGKYIIDSQGWYFITYACVPRKGSEGMKTELEHS